jgi:LysR family glycine cleavage system transcriptional activator
MPERLPPLNALRAFEVTGRHLSFTAAASELCVTPGAVSRQVKQLEQYLGLQLFVRGYREVSLTAAGRTLLGVLSDTFGQIGDVSRRLMRAHRNRPLTVFASMIFVIHWLMPRLGRFRGVHENNIRFTTSLTAFPDPFGDSDVDAAIWLGHDARSDMRCHRLIESRLLPICSPALLRRKPLRQVADLQHHTLLHSLVFPENWANWLAAVDRPDITGADNLSLGSTSLVYQAAIGGVGVALGQPTLIQNDVAIGRLVTPLAETLQDGKAYFLAYRESEPHNQALESFIAWLLEMAKDEHNH